MCAALSPHRSPTDGRGDGVVSRGPDPAWWDAPTHPCRPADGRGDSVVSRGPDPACWDVPTHPCRPVDGQGDGMVSRGPDPAWWDVPTDPSTTISADGDRPFPTPQAPGQATAVAQLPRPGYISDRDLWLQNQALGGCNVSAEALEKETFLRVKNYEIISL